MQSNENFILFQNHVEFDNWLQHEKVSRTIQWIQNHHTWKPDYSNFNGRNHFERLESMRSFHMKERSFTDIAQNLTTFPDGTIAYSIKRPFNTAPAGIKGANSQGICIEHFGNFDANGDIMNDQHSEAILQLNYLLCIKFNLPIDTAHVVYHHWYSTDGTRVYDFVSGKKLSGISAKSCPGTQFFGGNTVLDAQKNFIPKIRECDKTKTEADQSMTSEEKKEFEAVKALVTAQAKVLNNLIDQVSKLNDKHEMPIPSWAELAVESAVNAKIIDTPNKGSEDFYRLLTVLYRKKLI
ncbi:N-acetylmuramoyl-L-alanine amidase [Paenibacillus sp. NPDC058174]|uniref:peptidoglycan recognition protein family protein n=1 Tax=Paenibacillus sp. NPDC058174 TaxID=3346366 RepID=UPI0036DA2A17